MPGTQYQLAGIIGNLVRARAIENSTFIVATNMCGIHHTVEKLMATHFL